MRKDIEMQIEEKRNLVRAEIQKAMTRGEFGGHDLGHAFMWGLVEVKYKNGKTRKYRTCLTSVCSDNLSLVCEIVQRVPGVTGVWYNLD